MKKHTMNLKESGRVWMKEREGSNYNFKNKRCVCVCVLLRDFCLFLPTSFQKGTFMFSGELEYLDHKMIGSDIIFFTPKALKHLMYIEKETF